MIEDVINDLHSLYEPVDKLNRFRPLSGNRMLNVPLAISVVCHRVEQQRLAVVGLFLLSALYHSLTFEFDAYDENIGILIINKETILLITLEC